MSADVDHLHHYQIVWSLLVVTSFIISGVLVNDSFTAWEESPTVTSMRTLPISEASFPEVTLCPPEGHNTVLNYDLLNLNQLDIDKRAREELFLELMKLLYSHKYEEYLNISALFFNTESLRDLYEGRQKMSLIQFYENSIALDIR